MPSSGTKLTGLASGSMVLLLAGCAAPMKAPEPHQTVPEATAEDTAPGICYPAAAQRLIGKAKPSDADAMRLTGATLVRQIAPGDAVTHDLRDNRVTVETDPASGRVTNATCG